jgi:tight adherence protein B
MSPALLLLLTFLAVALGIFGVYSFVSDLYLRDRSRISRRVDEEFRRRQRERVRKSALFKNLGERPAAPLDEDPTATSPRRRFEAMVEQSGLDLSPERLLFLMLGFGLGAGFLAGLLRQSILTGVIVALVVGVAPFVYVYIKRRRRLEKMMAQLHDAFDLMARVIRAGQTISQAIQAVADEFDPPLAGEFAYCYEQQNLGLPAEDSLRDLARRTGVLEIKIFVLALLVQQQTGGNLAELLDKLAHVIRERFKIRSKIQALTAEGRLQAIILLALPFVMLLALLILNRDYVSILLDHPIVLVIMSISEFCGAVWIRKIVNFDF